MNYELFMEDVNVFLWCSNVVIYLVVYLRNNLSSKVVT